MSNVLTLKPKQKINPIVEILGPVDIGKTLVARLLNSQIGGTLITFPTLDPFSMTGRVLLSALNNPHSSIEERPEWWAHIYSANIYELEHKLKAAQEIGPVVVTNYMLGFRVWTKAANSKSDYSSKNFLVGLPETNIGFALTGSPIQYLDRPKFNFSTTLTHKIKHSFSERYMDYRIIKTPIPEPQKGRQTYNRVNDVVDSMTEFLEEKYKLNINRYFRLDKDSLI